MFRTLSVPAELVGAVVGAPGVAKVAVKAR
jgi:hypothetical protein